MVLCACTPKQYANAHTKMIAMFFMVLNFMSQTYSILFSQPNNDVTCFFPDVTSFEKCTE